MGDHEKDQLKAQNVNFSTGGQSYEKIRYFIFQFLAGVCANFHAWTLCNNKVIVFWPLPLEHQLRWPFKTVNYGEK